MKAFILLLLIAIPTFSQKLWEIDVTGNGNLTDVREIPNSELLLFTYNTGRLEIRRGSDGSFVNQLISKPGEFDGPVISRTGTLYYYRGAVDTIEFRDIITNEPVIKVSPEITELEGNPVFDVKAFQMFELFDNNTKIIGNLVYADKDDSRNNRPNYIIYNLVTKQIEYQRPIDTEGTDYYYSTIDKSYLSPDEKYIIEVSYVYPRARMFNLQTKTYEFEFDGENREEDSDKISALSDYKFINNTQMIFMSGTGFYIRSFPDFDLKYHIELFNKFGIYPANHSGYYLCGDELFFITGEKIPGGGSQDYRFWHIRLNIKTGEIVFNSKDKYTFKTMFNGFLIGNCGKIIIPKDFDNRSGIITCYDYNTLNIPIENPEPSYFSKPDSTITFNSSTFVGQSARIEIYNSVGAIVATLFNGIINQQNYNFNLPDLPSGAYYLQCQLPTQNLNFNFMVVI